MTSGHARGHLLDTSALAAIGANHRVSTLINLAPLEHLPLYAPVTCLEAADRIRQGIAHHAGQIPGVTTVDLTYAAVLELRERTPKLPLDVGHVVSLARPGPEWLAGLIVVTGQVDLYAAFDLPIYPIS